MTRRIEQRCDRCRYFELDGVRGHCRKRAPEPDTIVGYHNLAISTPSDKYPKAAWKLVECNDWCGEFKSDDSIAKGLKRWFKTWRVK